MSDKDFLLKTKFCYKGDTYLLETKRSLLLVGTGLEYTSKLRKLDSNGNAMNEYLLYNNYSSKEKAKQAHERMARQGKEGIKFWGMLAGYYAEK